MPINPKAKIHCFIDSRYQKLTINKTHDVHKDKLSKIYAVKKQPPKPQFFILKNRQKERDTMFRKVEEKNRFFYDKLERIKNSSGPYAQRLSVEKSIRPVYRPKSSCNYVMKVNNVEKENFRLYSIIQSQKSKLNKYELLDETSKYYSIINKRWKNRATSAHGVRPRT